ncbi:hypothetical protein C5C29_05320 [Rathayibacter sp. AY1H2]|nr:hypothetical protein C5C29_05320 [Rathayibacter sp. AY1H2]
MKGMTGAKNRSTPVKPLQDRAHRTRAAIVAAAREVVIEVGRDRATTAKVAARASVGIGTLYRYFVDFADVLEAVYAEHPIYDRHQAVLRAAHKATDSESAETVAVEALQELIKELRAESLLEAELRLYT